MHSKVKTQRSFTRVAVPETARFRDWAGGLATQAWARDRDGPPWPLCSEPEGTG